jgi:hypothetical protein
MNLKIFLNNLFSFNPGGETATFFVMLLLTFLLGVFSFLILYYRPSQKKSQLKETALNDKLSEAQKTLEMIQNENIALQNKFNQREEQILIGQISNRDNNVLFELTQQKNQKLEQDLKLLTSEKNNSKEELSKLKVLLAEMEKNESDLSQRIKDLTQKNIDKELTLIELANKAADAETNELTLIQSLEEVNNNLADAILQIEKLNREVGILNAVILSKEQMLEEKKNTEPLADTEIGHSNDNKNQTNVAKTGTLHLQSGQKLKSDLKKLNAMTRESELLLNSAGIYSIEQLASLNEIDFQEVISFLKDNMERSKLELWVAEANKILTKQKIILLTKDINLKKMFRKKT